MMEFYKQALELLGPLSFIRGYAREALKNADGREKERLETILAKATEGLIKAGIRIEGSPKYTIGSKVKWLGQQGECSGTVKEIRHPENSDYVLLIDIGCDELFPIDENGVSSAV